VPVEPDVPVVPVEPDVPVEPVEPDVPVEPAATSVVGELPAEPPGPVAPVDPPLEPLVEPCFDPPVRFGCDDLLSLRAATPSRTPARSAPTALTTSVRPATLTRSVNVALRPRLALTVRIAAPSIRTLTGFDWGLVLEIETETR
jgi:hypothetical protein